MGKISKRIIKEWSKEELSNFLDFNEFQLAKKKLSEVKSDIGNRTAPIAFDPNFRIYIFVQNLLSYFAEEISDHKYLSEYYNKVMDVEDNYMPSYPPMSPLTGAYFTYWAFCDLEFGPDKESITTILYDLCTSLSFEKEMLSALKNLSDSYMGFYQHMGFQGDVILLKEIATDNILKCICAASYTGKKDEIWYVRIVPNLDEKNEYGITLTTPYVVKDYGEEDWVSFYKRHSIEKGKYDFLKKNSNLNYWHEYIMDGYVSFTPNCIYLTGIPDIKGSKPHELSDHLYE